VQKHSPSYLIKQNLARGDSYIKAPIIVTFKTSNRSNAKVKKKVIRNRNIDEVLDTNTKIPGIPKSAIITHIGIGKKYIK
jgi:hypothetical protein|tara:strand:- start:1092 stop:1331 length:240 start_codon:yes stop_codon:yes gene_type:complete